MASTLEKPRFYECRIDEFPQQAVSDVFACCMRRNAQPIGDFPPGSLVLTSLAWNPLRDGFGVLTLRFTRGNYLKYPAPFMELIYPLADMPFVTEPPVELELNQA